jgi:hypothetical protein
MYLTYFFYTCLLFVVDCFNKKSVVAIISLKRKIDLATKVKKKCKSLKQSKGTGASGSFKIGEVVKPKKKPAANSPFKGGHPRTIPPKFGCNWPSCFWGEDNKNLILMKWSLDGSLPKMCPVVRPFDQDGPHSRTYQQSLVEIGSVVSEEKIFFKFHPPFFLICIIGQNFWPIMQIRKKGDEI